MTWGGSDNKPLGDVHILILRLIESGKATTLPAIRAGLKHRQSGENIPNMLAGLNRRGFVIQTGGGQYLVTKEGRKFLPTAQAPTFDTGDYQPPSYAPARPGAMDYARYPSVAAGVRRPYWGEKL
ncbi:MAG: hypothetical protein WC121_11915 [Candidatus Kapaibacterium sp.]